MKDFLPVRDKLLEVVGEHLSTKILPPHTPVQDHIAEDRDSMRK